MKKYILSAVFVSSLLMTSFAQDIGATLTEIEFNNQKSINKMINKSQEKFNTNQQVIDQISKLSQTNNLLFDNLTNSYMSNEDILYINSLEGASKELKKLSRNYRNNNEYAQKIASIQMDYDIKLKSAGLGIDAKPKSKIKVNVVTKKNEEPIQGYEVECNYMWDIDKIDKAIKFNNPTNDAIRLLAPGYYVFYIKKDGKEISRREKVEIGNLRQKEEEIIFNL